MSTSRTQAPAPVATKRRSAGVSRTKATAERKVAVLRPDATTGVPHADAIHFHAGDRALFPVDLYEAAEEYVVEACLPNIELEHLSLIAAEDRLIIRAPQQARATDQETPLKRERYAGPWTRAVLLPQPVASDSVLVIYERGILTLRVPKAAAAPTLKALE
jgi:HSP20 family protein